MAESTPLTATPPSLDAPQLALVRWQRRKLEITYWVMLATIATLNLIALLFIALPLLQLLTGTAFTVNTLYPAGLGLLLTVLLFLFRPLDRLHKLMAGMMPMVIALGAFEYRVAVAREGLAAADDDNAEAIKRFADEAFLQFSYLRSIPHLPPSQLPDAGDSLPKSILIATTLQRRRASPGAPLPHIRQRQRRRQGPAI